MEWKIMAITSTENQTVFKISELKQISSLFSLLSWAQNSFYSWDFFLDESLIEKTEFQRKSNLWGESYSSSKNIHNILFWF